MNKLMQKSPRSRKLMKFIEVKIVIKRFVRENISNLFFKNRKYTNIVEKTFLKNLI